MGYTHYWTNSKNSTPSDARSKFTLAFNLLREHSPDILGDVVITKDYIEFNGIDSDQHETMVIDFTGGGNLVFCKTARKPYDKFVVACLVLADMMGIIDEWSSDGESDDHKEGKLMLYEVLTDFMSLDA
jgi:hypothetical protein